jgi:hypothetical protein
MKTLITLTLFLASAGLLFASPPMAAASPGLTISLSPAESNPATPRMGDWLHFKTRIVNRSGRTLHALIAWISLVRTDRGEEQPIDLEDWSAHKAVTRSALGPGKAIEAKWPLRLIAAGHYRVVVSAVAREAPGVITSRFAPFGVQPKPVVESRRVLPVAAAEPLLLALAALWTLRRRVRQRRNWSRRTAVSRCPRSRET